MTDQKLSEDTEQLLVIKYLKTTDLLYHHSPNGGKRHIKTAKRLKALGCSAGFPDLLIFSKPKNLQYKDKAGLAIELKKVGTARPTVHQKRWLNDLARNGWISAVCHGHDAAIELINEVYRFHK